MGHYIRKYKVTEERVNKTQRKSKQKIQNDEWEEVLKNCSYEKKNIKEKKEKEKNHSKRKRVKDQ